MIRDILLIIIIYNFSVAITVLIYKAKAKKVEKKYIRLAIFPVYLTIASIPFFFVTVFFENGFMILISIIIIGYMVIRIGNTIYNKMKVSLSKNEGIYVRDVEVEYSPAVLSYLQNQRIEKKKDLVACVLNLCAKGFLKIDKKDENHYELKPLLDKNSEILKKDEKYLYDKICKKEKINMSTWIKYIREEFENYEFIRKSKITLGKVFICLASAIMVGGLLYSQITGNSQLNVEMIALIFVPIFVAIEIAIIEPFMRLIIHYLRKGEYLDGTYTIKGAKEMKRWDKYKKFLEDYTLLEYKPLESVMVLEKHLAYATVLNVNTSYTKSFIEQLEVTHKINLDDINDMLEKINKGA